MNATNVENAPSSAELIGRGWLNDIPDGGTLWSHNLLPTDLPYVVAGMIWDGATEYHNGLPPDVPRLLSSSACTETGTRRFSESVGTARPMAQFRAKTEQGWEQIGVTLTQPHSPIDYRNGGFLAYDGELSFDPANQFFLLNQFREHAARFAHQLDAAMGHHTLASADERDRLAVWNTMTTMIGSAARRYAVWNEIDPEELIIGGNFDGTPRWQRDLDDYIEIDEALCGQCDIATFARRFYLNADLREFARLWRQGISLSRRPHHNALVADHL